MSNRYRVYRNLTNGRLSIKQGSLVAGHCDGVLMGDCKFIVNENGRQRTVKEGRKNVHAFVEGHIGAITNFTPYKGRARPEFTYVEDSWGAVYMVQYNPFTMDKFSDRAGDSVETSPVVFIHSCGRMVSA